MATSMGFLFLFFLLFHFPCFFSSCETTLPCNISIQIRPPFFIYSPDPNCGNFLVLCENNDTTPYIYIFYSVVIPLESISYETNTIRVKDPSLTRSLQRSNCSSIYFEFPSPVNNFDSHMYSSLNTNFASIKCNSTDLIQSPPNTFRKDYNLKYSTIGDRNSSVQKNCSNYNSVPSFELTISFNGTVVRTSATMASPFK